ncbi:dienelactone hydrolase [Geobacter metallireducens RCH3]|uniref:Dienelactone hydrolase family protein n=1 Tax=Geobacter metallireducens (strain ATCC 53774 / DSM 7210 / GS-15) TaxID=269799 RepID=Q39XJ2_GEOMG|nr:dienelactone hydrolase family protein [Geobacter metallireducens]ABB31032.1 dienelactone hydrolase family protein [Geobacter metallireducens GS-15]EHP86038.1 dienelactone hydrolase [Geobacter metallireducens RCH3]
MGGIRKFVWVAVALAGGFLGVSTADAAVQGKVVEYRDGEVTMKGYLAWNDTVKGKRPGVLVVHEWWGLNDYARKRARMLAELGYTALAVDMYGGGKEATHPDDAGAFSSAVMKNMDLMAARFRAAMEFLKKQPTVDAVRIGAIGYCFGGAVVLNMARQGLDLKGVASFHGNLATAKPAGPGTVKAKVTVFNGGADTLVPPEQVGAFTAEMTRAGAAFRFFSYPGAKHAFTNPDADVYARKFGLPLAYDAAADRDSWEEMKRFFREVFGR